MVWSGYGRLTNSGELKIQVIFWDDSEWLGLKLGAKESRRLYVSPQWFLVCWLTARDSGLHETWDAISKTCSLVIQHLKLEVSSTNPPSALDKFGSTPNCIIWKTKRLLESLDTPWSRGSLSLLGRRQFTSLVSTDPSPLLQSSHFTSESKAGLTMEHSPSLFFFLSPVKVKNGWVGALIMWNMLALLSCPGKLV